MERNAQRASKLDIDPRISAGKVRKDARQQIGGIEIGRAKPDLSLDLRRREARFGLVVQAQDRPRILQQQLAILRQHEATSITPEQFLADRIFQLLDLLAYRRLRPSDALGGGREAPGVDYSDEALEQQEIKIRDHH
jgi:hypothetical protein